MRTKERIIHAARLLFNEEGERYVSMVDIASTLEISPGNLYYYYRGKEELIPALFTLYEAEICQMLNRPLQNLQSLIDLWGFLHLVLEVIDNNRFIYTSLTDFIQHDKNLSRRFTRILSLKQKTIAQLLNILDKERLFSPEKPDVITLSETFTLFLCSWSNYSLLRKTDNDDKSRLNHGVLHMMNLLSPNLKRNNHFEKNLQDIFKVSNQLKPFSHNNF